MTNHRKIIVHTPIIEFGNSMIRKMNVILTPMEFLMFLLKKRKFWEELMSPTSLHMTKLVKTTQFNCMKFSLLTSMRRISTSTEIQ